MIRTDIRFSAENLADIQSIIGEKMIKIKCDPFEFSTSVYGIVGISFRDVAYSFTNLTEVMDYYGTKEDVAIFRMERNSFPQIKSLIQNQTMIETPVESIVSEILIVNEHQQLFNNNELLYDVLLTRGIIFHFEDGHELSLEKNIWFSEDISVEKGYNLIDRFSSTSEFPEGWSAPYQGKCSREIVSIK